MKINDLNINSYGRLNNRKIELKKGLNIVKGHNEAGKSTILSFLNSMLFGIDKKKQGQYISEYDRFMPWISEEFSGNITYELDNGEKYEIFRNFKKKNPVIYDGNKNDISKEFAKTKNGIEFLESQIGIDKATFQNSSISYQKLVVLNDNDKSNIIQKMTNLVNTGEENISYANILKKITNRQLEEIGSSRTKKRPINNVDEALLKLENDKRNIDEIEIRKTQIDEERKQIQYDFSEIDVKKEIIFDIKNHYLENGDSHINTKIYDDIKEKQDTIFELKQQKIDTITEEKPGDKIKIPNIILFVLTLIACISIYSLNYLGMISLSPKMYFGINTEYILMSATVFVYLALISGLYFGAKSNIKKNLEEAEEKNRNIEKDVLLLRKEIMNLEKELEREKEENTLFFEKYKQAIKEKYKNRIFTSYIDEVLAKKPGELAIESKKIDNKHKNIIFKLSAIDAEKNMIEKTEFELSQIIEKKIKLEEEKEELLNYNEAFEISKEILIQSYDQMKDNIGPGFNERLSTIVSKITEDKYTDVVITKNNEINVRNESGEYVSLELLSTGTIEQVNLALRITLLEVISNETLPIILDEAFAFYDDKRLENIIGFLVDEYKERQIIIFTCSDRELEILEKMKRYNEFEYNSINI